MDRQSRYCYPGTDVLINLYDIRDLDELQRVERILTKERLAELAVQPVKGQFDLSHLQEIHRYIFQDIYPFAGQLRTEDIAKGSFRFAPTQYMEPSAKELFQQLRQENYLKGASMDQFADRAAHYMAEINVLHPFREGNGRAQREFIRQLAKNAGFELDWGKIDKTTILEASIRSKVDTKDLADVIRSSLKKDPEKLKDILKQLEGLPTIRSPYLPDHQALNREVSNYRVQKKGEKEILQFRFKGEEKIHTIDLEKVPYLSREKRDQWIEQAARNVKSISLNRGLEK